MRTITCLRIHTCKYKQPTSCERSAAAAKLLIVYSKYNGMGFCLVHAPLVKSYSCAQLLACTIQQLQTHNRQGFVSNGNY